MPAAVASKADLDDQRWLDERVDALRDGIEAARDIWLNWTAIRNVSRFADGQSYGDFIASRLGYALPLAEVIQIMPGASTREIAKVAGVSNATVSRAKSGVADVTPDDQPATVLGADGKQYPARKPQPEPEPPVLEGEVIEPPTPPVIDLRPLFRALEELDLFAQANGPVPAAAAMSDTAKRAVGARVRRVHSFLGRLSVELKGDN